MSGVLSRSMDPTENDDAPGIDMSGWTDEDKAAFAAARLAAEEEEHALAEEDEAINGTPAQRAIAAERERVKKATAERQRLKVEAAEKKVRAELLAKHGATGVLFYPSKMGMVAVKVPTRNAMLALTDRLDALPRKIEKADTLADAVREQVLYPSKDKVKEIEKAYPFVMAEINGALDDHMRARDYTARPYE